MSFNRQQVVPLGPSAHAVWCRPSTEKICGNEPFAVVLSGQLVLNTPGCQADDAGLQSPPRREVSI